MATTRPCAPARACRGAPRRARRRAARPRRAPPRRRARARSSTAPARRWSSSSGRSLKGSTAGENRTLSPTRAGSADGLHRVPPPHRPPDEPALLEVARLSMTSTSFLCSRTTLAPASRAGRGPARRRRHRARGTGAGRRPGAPGCRAGGRAAAGTARRPATPPACPSWRRGRCRARGRAPRSRSPGAVKWVWRRTACSRRRPRRRTRPATAQLLERLLQRGRDLGPSPSGAAAGRGGPGRAGAELGGDVQMAAVHVQAPCGCGSGRLP